MGQFIVSARKYRPGSFETLLGQENIAKTLKNSILRDQLAHAYLFCGPRGVGKTSAARIFAKTINCQNPGPDMEPCGECESCRSFAENRSYSIHELDAASNNSVDDIRQLTDTVRIPPQVGRYSVYIIDEVHMLSTAAFNAFLKTLEEPPAHAIFILATTEKHKILPTILSRCQTYDFNRISIEDMVRNISHIAKQEGVTISEDAMHVIAQKADGAMRDALTLFDQSVAFCGNDISYDKVISNLNILDHEYYFRLTDCFAAGDYVQAMLIFDEILTKGFNAQNFIAGLSSHMRDLLVCKHEASKTLVSLAPSVARRYAEYSASCSPRFLFEALNITTACEAAYKSSGNPRLLIEFALMKLCNLSGAISAPQTPAATPAAVPSATPTATPLASPSTAPAPAPAARKSGPSIKAMMQEISAVPVEKSEEQSQNQIVITEDRLKEAWALLVQGESQRPSLSSALSSAKPRIEDGHDIHFEVKNMAQKEWIDRNCRARLESTLQKSLSSSALRLIVDVAQIKESDENKLYMPSDKVDYLQKNSSEFRELKKTFELENS